MRTLLGRLFYAVLPQTAFLAVTPVNESPVALNPNLFTVVWQQYGIGYCRQFSTKTEALCFVLTLDV